jgi:magnesium transporter
VSDPQALEANVERVRQLLEAGEEEKLRRHLEAFHPSDLADLLELLDEEERAPVLHVLPDELASETLAEMEEEEHPEELLIAVPERVPELVHELSVDDAADIIGELPADKQQEVLAQLPDEEAEDIRDLLAYDEESAGGVMTTQVVAVQESASVGEAIAEIRRQVAEGEEYYTVFVVDEGGRMDQEEVARMMSRYNLVSVPVVDPADRLIGRITFDDVMDIVEAETTEDILRFSGVLDEEYLHGGVGQAVKNRLPWLAVALLTTSIAAVIIYLYRETVEQIVILAAIMPVIAALGGNAGTQALAVTVRRLALSPERSGARRVVIKELTVGLVNGAAIGLLAALVGFLLPEGSLSLGLVVLLAMWGNLIVAGFAGAFVPVLLEKLGVDPAVASAVFFTALTDIFGFFFLLSLASWILLPHL